MRSEPKAFLIAMYASRGDRIVRDPELCYALLRDGCEECRREVAILVNTVRCGAAQELLGSTAPYPSLRARLIQKVQDEQGLTPEAASWGVDTWREALTGSAPKAQTPERPTLQPERPRSKKDSEYVNALLASFGFILIAGAGVFLAFCTHMFLVMTHLTDPMTPVTMVSPLNTFFMRASGWVGAVIYLSSFRFLDLSLWPTALVGGISGGIAFVLITWATDISGGGLLAAIVFGALVAAGLSKRSPKNVAVAGSSSSGK